jgi:steroid delta-isomerase-like uncharacterized protein
MDTPAARSEVRVREVFRRLFDDRDLSDPYAFWSDDSVDHFVAAGQTLTGAPALATWFTGLFAAVLDWKMTVENVVADGQGQVAVQWTGSGHFTGAAFLGIEPTGRRIELQGCDVIRLDAEGRFAANTVYYDGAAFARQVGLLPSRGSSTDRLMTKAFNAVTRIRRRLRVAPGRAGR